jgi:hypothetical protein
VVLRNMRKDGELFWNDLSITPVHDEHGLVTHYIGVMVDVTAAKQRTAHLEHEVNHDPLTGLANRNLLWDRLEQALHLAQRQKSMVATVLIDLEQVQGHQRHLGHEAGDVVLTWWRGACRPRCATATRWRACRATNSCWCWPTSPRCASPCAWSSACARACDSGVLQGTRDPGRRQRRRLALSARRLTAAELMRAADSPCTTARHNGRDEVISSRPT